MQKYVLFSFVFLISQMLPSTSPPFHLFHSYSSRFFPLLCFVAPLFYCISYLRLCAVVRCHRFILGYNDGLEIAYESNEINSQELSLRVLLEQFLIARQSRGALMLYNTHFPGS